MVVGIVHPHSQLIGLWIKSVIECERGLIAIAVVVVLNLKRLRANDFMPMIIGINQEHFSVNPAGLVGGIHIELNGDLGEITVVIPVFTQLIGQIIHRHRLRGLVIGGGIF